MSTSFDGLISKVKECGQKTVSVAVAQDSAVLEAVRAAKDRGIANAILVGDEAKLKRLPKNSRLMFLILKSSMNRMNGPLPLPPLSLPMMEKPDMYMKGLLETKTFLKSILDKEVGLRTGAPCHMSVYLIPPESNSFFLLPTLHS